MADPRNDWRLVAHYLTCRHRVPVPTGDGPGDLIGAWPFGVPRESPVPIRRRLGIHREDTMVTIGVDTHKRLVVAVALDATGQVLAEWSGDNTPDGWDHLQTWAQEQGSDQVWGIEGSGQYGRGLAQQLVAAGAMVAEINPRWTAAARQRARQPGKSDRRDATAIAQVVRQEGSHLPQLHPEDATSVVALLTSERTDAVRMATQVRNQLHQ